MRIRIDYCRHRSIPTTIMATLATKAVTNVCRSSTVSTNIYPILTKLGLPQQTLLKPSKRKIS